MPSRYRAIADYYDAEHADTDWLRQDVPFFLDQLPRRRRLDVLELCVGTARAAIPIAAAGHRVVGVDYDADLLAIAGRKRDAAGLAERQLELVHADALAFASDRRFDWACVFFNTLLVFTTLAEQDHLLGTTVRPHLKPGGRLWVDVFNPDLALLSVPRSTGLQPQTFHVPSLGRTVSSTTDVQVDAAAQRQRVTFHYTWFDAAGRRRQERSRFELTWFFPRELRLLLERNGFHVEAVYGDYDGSPVTDASPRLIVCCRVASPGTVDVRL